jgi:hypothetical protein
MRASVFTRSGQPFLEQVVLKTPVCLGDLVERQREPDPDCHRAVGDVAQYAGQQSPVGGGLNVTDIDAAFGLGHRRRHGVRLGAVEGTAS